MRELVFDAGPFILVFTREKGSDIAREAVLGHQGGELGIYIHPNNLSEAYTVISEMRALKPEIMEKDVDPRTVIRSAYATLNVLHDEETTANLGMLKRKYVDRPWGDLSAASLALRLSDRIKVPVVVLDDERHFKDLSEIETVRISDLRV